MVLCTTLSWTSCGRPGEDRVHSTMELRYTSDFHSHSQNELLTKIEYVCDLVVSIMLYYAVLWIEILSKLVCRTLGIHRFLLSKSS